MVTFICLFVGGFGGWVALEYYRATYRRRDELEEAYREAIQSGDKSRALAAGRAYYSDLRGGKLTLYDEQAIANDLSTMR